LEETWATYKAFHTGDKFNIHIPRSQVLPYEVEATIAIVFDSQNPKLYGGGGSYNPASTNSKYIIIHWKPDSVVDVQ
jgi:hypothetical protein